MDKILKTDLVEWVKLKLIKTKIFMLSGINTLPKYWLKNINANKIISITGRLQDG